VAAPKNAAAPPASPPAAPKGPPAMAIDSRRFCDDCGVAGAADVDITHWHVDKGKHVRGQVDKVVRRWCCGRHIASRLQAGLKVVPHDTANDEPAEEEDPDGSAGA